MVAVDRRRLKLFFSLYRYQRQINNAYQKKVCLAIIQIIRTRQRRLAYIFYILIKEVINLVKLKGHADVSYERGADGVP